MADFLDACIVSSPLALTESWFNRLPASQRRADERYVLQPGGNFRFAIRPLAQAGGGRLAERCLDLLEVAAAVYLTDQLVRRPSLLVGARRIALHVHLRNPEAFEEEKAALEAALLFLSRDHWALKFHSRAASPSWEETLSADPVRTLPEADSVCLFSGGLDSLAGSLHLYQDGRKPVLLSHSRSWKSRQRKIHEKLAGVTAQPLVQFDTGFDNRGAPAERRLHRNDTSQRVRAFLYLAAAAALARALDLRDVFICENGPLACAVPAQPHLVPTRHAHPHVLGLLELFFSHVLEQPIRLHNPFLLLTKGQALAKVSATLRKHALEEAITSTVSCWQYFARLLDIKPPNLACGACVPCLVRRSALHRAGFSDSDADVWLRLEEAPGRLAASFAGHGKDREAAVRGEERVRRAWLAFHRLDATLGRLGSNGVFFGLPEAGELLRRPGLRELEAGWRVKLPAMYREFTKEFRERFPLP